MILLLDHLYIMPSAYKSIRLSGHLVSFISFMTVTQSSPLRIVMVVFRALVIAAHHCSRPNKYDASILKSGSTFQEKIK